MRQWFRLVLTRDNLFLLMGGGGLVNEFFIRTGPERETVILACLALMGVPYVRNVDKRHSRSKDQTGDDKSNEISPSSELQDKTD